MLPLLAPPSVPLLLLLPTNALFFLAEPLPAALAPLVLAVALAVSLVAGEVSLEATGSGVGPAKI